MLQDVITPVNVPLVAVPCSVAPPGTEIHDPYEPFNRQVHAFNRGLDAAVARGDLAPERLDSYRRMWQAGRLKDWE